MQDVIINSSNVVRATECLLAFDSSAIETPYRADAYHWIIALKDALERYQLHLQKHYLVMFTEERRHEVVQQSLESLIPRAIGLAQILTPDAKEQLKEYLANPEAPLPQIIPQDK